MKITMRLQCGYSEWKGGSTESGLCQRTTPVKPPGGDGARNRQQEKAAMNTVSLTIRGVKPSSV